MSDPVFNVPKWDGQARNVALVGRPTKGRREAAHARTFGIPMLESKYPDPPLVKKMAAIAEALGARLKGEEGETYDEHTQPHAPPLPTRSQKIGTWWRNLFATPLTPLNESEVLFKVGDRVRESFGSKRQGTVTRIDLRAEHGLGLITVKYDDGREISSAAGQPGLEKCE